MIYRYSVLCVSALITLGLLNACGSGSNNIGSEPVTVPPSVNIPTAPERCINEQYPIMSATDDGSYLTDYSPEKATDNDLGIQSRWLSVGVNESLVLDLGSLNPLGALKIKWYKGDERQSRFLVDISTDNSTWTEAVSVSNSSGRHSGFELVNTGETEARFIRINGLGNADNDENSIVEIEAHKCENADGEIVSEFPNDIGIDLLDWYLSIPTDDDNSGTADTISENELAAGYTHSEFFYASADNGIVMRSPSYGYKTSANTSYVRVELREMLRRGDSSVRTQGVNKNNWVFGSASSTAKTNAGGVDGELNVTLAVNNVTTTGESYQIGRLVIGQIHANDDEPIRLYYRKLPNNERGSIYFAHESRVKDGNDKNIETFVDMIGSRNNSAANPADGIALNEKFSYRIQVTNNLLTVTIIREGKADVSTDYDMAASLYDDDSQYHYFKVGVYHLNNSSDPSEFAQATFYEIRNSHMGYVNSE